MKKIVSIALVLLLIVTMIPMAVFASESKATDIVDTTGKAAGDKITLGGVEYTLIDSADDVAAMDGSYYLMNDLELTANLGNNFVGNFNGGGHTITLNGATSVFGQWVGAGTSLICNFTMASKDNATLTCPQWGSPLGCYASKGGTFHNITNNVNITGTGNYIAGIIGGHSLANGEIIITDCVNNGSITVGATKYYHGGILGGLNGAGAKATIDNCVNNGKITVTVEDGNHGYQGGIFGGIPKNCNNATATITNCKNAGEIDSKMCHVGGIVGSNYTSNGVTFTVENCENTGKITANKYAGGVLGGNYSGALTANIKNCTNKGEITANSGAAGIVAGIHPLASGNTAAFVIENCANEGNITATEYAGSIVGFFNGQQETVTITATDCTNVGTITGGTDGSGDPAFAVTAPAPVVPEPEPDPEPTPDPEPDPDPVPTSDITVYAIVIATIALAGVVVAKKKIRE